MYARAAGMSDSELEDDEDFTFAAEEKKSFNYEPRGNSYFNNTNRFDNGIRDEYDCEQFEEFNVINACMMGNLDIIQEYLKTHNANEPFHTGWTPLLYASLSAQPQVIQYLLENQADPFKHKDGYTPLMALCNSTKSSTETRLKCLALLLQANADANATNRQRETCLMYACTTQPPEFVAELLKHIKNVNARDSRDKTALMCAVIANKSDVVKLLLENSADISLTDYNGMTAKDMAATKRYTEALTLLDPEENEITSICETSEACDWKDMFPSLVEKKNNDVIDCDVSGMLYGMGLEHYSNIFRGMDLKTFLALTKEDLDRLGMDISAQKRRFMEYLHKFHMKKWNTQSLGAISKSSSYTIYHGVVSLGTVGKHIRVIGSSFQYIKNNLIEAAKNDVLLTEEQISQYKEELKSMWETVGVLKKELEQMKTLAQKINEEDDIGVPSTYIGPKISRTNWPVALSITVIIGMYLFRSGRIQRLWNN